MKTLVITALLVAITIPPITTNCLDQPSVHSFQNLANLWFCPRYVRHASDLRTRVECCMHPHTMMTVPGAAKYCCEYHNVCCEPTTPSTTAATTTTTTSAPFEGLDEPFLFWPQSSADTFTIMMEDIKPPFRPQSYFDSIAIQNEVSYELISASTTELRIVEDFLDKTTFIFRAGLCGERSTVSIESKHYPGMFWRHQDSIMKLHSKEETDLFKKDSCFKFSQGDCNDGSFTLESVNNPGYFIQKCDYQMKLRTEAENCGDISNKCWVNPVSQQASLAYCSTNVTEELHVSLNPECCHHYATLEEFGECCLEIMNDNEDGCYEKPSWAKVDIKDLSNCPMKIIVQEEFLECFPECFPECCLYPPDLYPSKMVEGVKEKCWSYRGVSYINQSYPIINQSILSYKKREKRETQGCPSTCGGLWYCVRKMISETKWYESYPECCCHPYRKYAMLPRNHAMLYNEECMALGLPDLTG